jgi:hypothetical protein
MEIEKVIHSSNNEQFYLDFWEVVSKIWRVKFGITPILLYFGESKVSEQYGEVIKMKVVEGVPENTCCQLSRYWFPSTEGNTVFMTSDIDMLPISTWYFKDQIKDISYDKFINLNCVKDNESYFPCCYNVAKGSTFKEILQLQNNWEDFINVNFNSWKKMGTNHSPDGLNKSLPNWSADEEWSGRMINQFDKNRIIKIYRPVGPDYMRINRTNWGWNENLIHQYYDCHSIRPYSIYKDEIDRLVALILK